MNKLKKYEYCGVNKCHSFTFDGVHIDLDTITDKEVSKLLNERPNFKRYFRPVKKQTSTSTKEAANERKKES